MTRIKDLCTFHRDGLWCGLVKEDETNHVWPNERMRSGAHVWRHDPKDAPALEAALQPVLAAPRSAEYERGYQAGYHAGIRSLTRPRPIPVIPRSSTSA